MKSLVRSAALLLAFTAPTAFAQMSMTPAAPGKPLASPAASTHVTLAGKKITVDYHTPSMRGRVIMGGLVPYGEVWRTGANEATSFVTEAPLRIGSLMVPAGAYTLYTLPAAPGTPWKLILSKQTGQWGTVYKPEMDLCRVDMKSATLAAPQEVMSISFEKISGNYAELHVKWETTDEFVPVTLAK